MTVKYIGWDVKLYWKSNDRFESTIETGMNSGWPESMTALEVIAEVIHQRGVQSERLTSVEATRTPISWEIEEP